MNHKSILSVLSALFCLSISNSVFSIKRNLHFLPELFFIVLFALLIFTCILFFFREDKIVSKNDKKSFIQVNDQNMIIGKHTNISKRRDLFLKVSIITFLSNLTSKKN